MRFGDRTEGTHAASAPRMHTVGSSSSRVANTSVRYR